MVESKPPSFHTQERPPSYVDDNDKNQTRYAKPPSLSDVAPPRPVSINEDQQRQQFAEKAAPTLAEVRPGQDSYQEGDGTHGGVGVNAKIPSFQDVAPGKGKSEHDEGHEERKEKLPSQSDVRTPNQNDSSGHQGHRIRVNKPPSSYNGKNYEKYSTCPLCDVEDEDCSHIFVKCGFAFGVWSNILRWCNIRLVLINDMEDLFKLHKQVTGPKWAKKIIRGIVMVTCWAMWNVRNKKVFDNTTPKVVDVVALVKSLSFLWLKHRSSFNNIVWKDWAMFPLYML